MTKTKYTNNISPTEELTYRKEIPEDYHCRCEYCTGNFLAELYDVENDTYYSQKARSRKLGPDTMIRIIEDI